MEEKQNPTAPADAARQFLEALFAGKSDGDYILIWLLDGKRSAWFTDIAAAAAFVQANAGRDVYVGVALSPADHGPYLRLKIGERMPSSLVGLYADLDVVDGVHKKNLPPTAEDALGLLFPEFPPSIIVHSGGGLQAWWIFKEPWELKTEEDVRQAGALATRWIRALRARAQAKGWDLDCVGDLPRVLRVPGTSNCKIAGQPRPVQLTETNDRRYNPSDLSGYLDMIGAEGVSAKIHIVASGENSDSASGAATPTGDRPDLSGIIVRTNVTIDPDLIEGLDLEFRALLDNPDPDQSHADWKLLRYIFRSGAVNYKGKAGMGFTPQSLTDWLVWYRNRVAKGEHRKKKTKLYYIRTIGKWYRWLFEQVVDAHRDLEEAPEPEGGPSESGPKPGPHRDPIAPFDHPYRHRDGGIIRIKDGKDKVEEVRLANFLARITANVIEDDGVEERRIFEIEARVHGQTYSFGVVSGRFSSMEWVCEKLGAAARILPNQKDWARDAVQAFSTDIEERRVYTHTGWRKIGDQYAYLHAGGAIGADGAVPGVEMQLTGALGRYDLVLSDSHKALIKAIRASLRVLDIGSNRITFPVLAATYRACIRPCDFTLWASGPTGVFKSELAALAQQHYGAAMDARRLPANFLSTANSLEALAFSTKDALLVVDDFAPRGSAQDIARYHTIAERLIRGAGNAQGRGRLTAEAKLRPQKEPRGLVFVTGEDIPRGQSSLGRTFLIEVAKGDVDIPLLTECQAAAAAGTFTIALAGFIRWLAADYHKLIAAGAFLRRTANLRTRASGAHSRTPGIVADLYAGFDLFTTFASEVGAISLDGKKELLDQCWATLGEVAGAQRIQQEAAEPTIRFLSLLRGAIRSGEAHLASADDGNPPKAAESWGWQYIQSGQNSRWQSQGRCIGWIDGPDLYLEPVASYATAQELARKTTEPLPVSEAALRKRLHEKHLLASTDAGKGHLTVRQTIQGRRTRVLHLLLATLAEE